MLMEGSGFGVRCPVRAGGGEGTSCLGLSWAPARARLLPPSGPAMGELRVGTPLWAEGPGPFRPPGPG